MYVPSLCNTHLAQQEELVGALLSVLITRALHLLQVNSIQLELLLDKNRTSGVFFPAHARIFLLCAHVRDIMRWVHWDYARTIQDEQRRYEKQFWKKSHELESVIKIFRSCVLPPILPFITGCFSHINSLQVPEWEFSECAKTANEKQSSNLFFKNTRERNERLHQCGRKSVSQAAQCAQLHIYVRAPLLLFYSLFCWILSHTGINPRRGTSEFCKCGLCVIINCSQTCVARAAFWQQANMLPAGCRLWVGLWTSSACDRCVTPSLTESRTSSQREHKKQLKKSGSKHKYTGRLAKRARWLKCTIS